MPVPAVSAVTISDVGLETGLMILALVSIWCDIGLVLSKLVSRPNIFRSLLHNGIIVFAVPAKCIILLHSHRPQQHANKNNIASLEAGSTNEILSVSVFLRYISEDIARQPSIPLI